MSNHDGLNCTGNLAMVGLQLREIWRKNKRGRGAKNSSPASHGLNGACLYQGTPKKHAHTHIHTTHAAGQRVAVPVWRSAARSVVVSVGRCWVPPPAVSARSAAASRPAQLGPRAARSDGTADLSPGGGRQGHPPSAEGRHVCGSQPGELGWIPIEEQNYYVA